MRVLILEPDLTGHHAPYLRHLIAELAQLDQEIIVVTSAGSVASPQFKLHLSDVSDRALFEEVASRPGRNKLSFATWECQMLKHAIAAHRPDHVWVPHADRVTEFIAALSAVGKSSPWRRDVETEGLQFRGRFAYPAEHWRKRIIRSLSRYLVLRAPWTILHWLDPLALNALQQLCPTHAERFRLMPDPVENVTQIAPEVARNQMDIPTDGRYIGCLGVIRHIGTNLLLAGYRRARLKSEDRFLLAGPLDDLTRNLINSEYSDLLRTGRLIVIDRHLSVDELMVAVMACDLVCTPRPIHIGSSSFVIRAAAAERPVLTTHFGWSGWAVSRFGLGWTADLLDTTALAAAMRESLEQAAGWRTSAMAKRFIRYHSPENFQAHWTARLRERLRMPPDERIVPWSTVLEPEPASA